MFYTTVDPAVPFPAAYESTRVSKPAIIEAPLTCMNYRYESFFEWRRKPEHTHKRAFNDFDHFKRVTIAADRSLSSFPCYLSSNFVVGPNGQRLVWEKKLTDPLLVYGGWFGEYGRFDKDLPAIDRLADDRVSRDMLPLDQLDALVAVAAKRMLPGVQNEISLLNFIYELKDLPSFRESVAKVVKLVKGIATNRYRDYRRRSLAVASDSYLQKEFNISPLYSDMSSIIRTMYSLKTRANEYLANEGKLIDKHYAKPISEFTDRTEVVPVGDGNLLSYVCRMASSAFENILEVPWAPGDVAGYVFGSGYAVRSVKYSTQFRAHLRCSYELSDMQREHALSLAAFDMLGLNFNPSIVWAAIPWSFVVDWFVGLSRYLDSLKTTWTEPRVKIHRFGWSVRRTREISCYADLAFQDPIDGSATRQRVYYPTVQETAYHRHLYPLSISWLTTSGLSLKEFSLASALLLSRERRRKGRFSKKLNRKR